MSTPLRGGFYRYFTQFIEKLPIRTINFSNATERDQHDTLTGLADHILESKRQDTAADTSALEHEIDQLVYGLYDLTKEEIEIVEGKKEGANL